ncbi:hypothetical protein TNCT_476761 [Trichonephila clavata]|uniref:Uncharacterized protein n=1 Tax=Trichonephila clavata TaxID=2740835 RepID=A0A8X6GZP1_TRICU|nr:hypothetical protein TNCT_476761 [Trichonephila clavata]
MDQYFLQESVKDLLPYYGKALDIIIVQTQDCSGIENELRFPGDFTQPPESLKRLLFFPPPHPQEGSSEVFT